MSAFTISLALCALIAGIQADSLSDFIRHYEPLSYDSESLVWNHHRVRRSIMGEPHLPLQFTAYGREFDIQLKPERRLFHKNFTLTFDGKKVSSHLAKQHLYTGTDKSDPSVVVHGNMAQDLFEGTVFTDDEIYHIEPSNRYLRDADYHSVIYRQSDLDLSTLSTASCGSAHQEVRRGILQMQQDAINSAESARLKRQSGNRDPDLVRCWLFARADFRFYTAVEATGADTVGIMLNVILTASTIFERTDFDTLPGADGIHFGILGMDVETMPSGDFFDTEFIGVQAFLNEHSTFDWSNYCLSYRFTHRDFNDGVVGLAYIGPQPGSGSSGGICEDLRTFSDGQKTLNTGIVTTLNYGQRIPPAATALTFAHEAGHNFGSNHDPRPDTPNPDGVYIMDAFSSDGSQPNNRLFSPRSRDEMFPVIMSRGQDTSNGCFEASDSLCGNNLLDEGEDCDCGPTVGDDGICTENACCNGTACALSANVECSGEQGPCCDKDTCMFVSSAANKECSAITDCAEQQTCNGTIATCPDPVQLPNSPMLDYRLCANESAICVNGFCTGTVCVALGLPDCECGLEQACHVCCKLGGVNGTCTSTIDIGNMNISGLASQLPSGVGAIQQIGFPCLNFTGHCDFFNNCMIVNEDGALTQLTNLIFSSAEFQQVILWITTMWWAVLLIGIGLIVILFIFVLLFHLVLPRPEKLREKKRLKKQEHLQMEQVYRRRY